MGAANQDQDSFRYRDDDGGEAAATWRKVANTNDTLEVDTSYRMRILVQETNGGSRGNVDLEFQYNKNDAGWNFINAGSSVIKAVTSTHFTNGDDCTQQIGSGTFIADNDGMTEDGISGGAMLDFAGNDESETELCFQIISGDVADGDTIQMVVTRDDGVSLETYSMVPAITVNKGGVLNKESNETVQIADAVLRNLGIVRASAETVQLSDQVLRNISFIRVVTETAQIADAVLGALSLRRIANETLQIADSVLNFKILFQVVGEAVQIAGAVLRSLSLARQADESSQVVDGGIRLLSLRRAVDESLQVADGFLRSLSILRATDETIQISDVGLGFRTLWRVVAETMQISDGVQEFLAKLLNKVADESVNIADALLRRMDVARLVSSVVQVSDQRLRFLSLVRVLCESLQMADSALSKFAGAVIKLANEAVQVADAVLRNVYFRKIVNETVQLADGVAHKFAGALVRIANEAMQLSESALRNLFLVRVADSSIQLAEAVLFWLGSFRFVNEAVQLADGVGRAGTLRRIINESVYLAGDIYSNNNADLTDWQKYRVTGDGPNQMTDQGGYFRIECADYSGSASAYTYYRYNKVSAYNWKDYWLRFKYLGRGGTLPDTVLTWALRYSTLSSEFCTCMYFWAGGNIHKFSIGAYQRILHLNLSYTLQPGDVIRTECSGPPGNVLESIYVNDVMKYSQTDISLANFPCNPSGSIMFKAGNIFAYGDAWWEFDDILAVVTSNARFLDLRRLVPEDVRIADAPVAGRIFYRIMAEAVDIAEQIKQVHGFVKMASEAVQVIDEVLNRFGGLLIRIINEAVRISDVASLFEIILSSIVPRAFARVFRAGKRPKTFYKE